MKVLILHQYVDRSGLVRSLREHLTKSGISADSYNVVYGNFCSKRKGFIFWFIKVIALVMKIPKARGFLIKYFRKIVLNKLSKEYDIIDIHFLSSIYADLIPIFKQNGVKMKSTIWGSDFYRVKDINKKILRESLNQMSHIQVATSQMKIDLSSQFPEIEDKINLAHFGLNKLELIEEIKSQEQKISIRDNYKIDSDKIVITVGTNGNQAHQHKLVLKHLARLSETITSKLHLIVPFTYGASNQYIEEIRRILDKLSLNYTLIDRSLSEIDICRLRIVTDILVTIQTTDAMSAAVQEHLFAGSIVVCGNWLPYNIFEESGVFFIRIKEKELTDKLAYCVENYEELREKSVVNNAAIYKLSSWSGVVTDWIRIYKEVASA